MVLIPVTVTDPMNRLITGLEEDDFQVFESGIQQQIKTLPARTRRFRSASFSISPVP